MNVIAVLRGLVLNPRLVAAARGLVESMVMAGFVYASDATFLNDVLPEAFKPFIPGVLFVLRLGEGHADAIDPAKQRRRDALRADAKAAEISDGAAGPLNPGDVKDEEVDSALERYNAGDYT